MKKTIAFLFIVIFFSSCNEPAPRRPISKKSGTFIKESVARNKELLASEEKQIEDLLKKDSIHDHLRSSNGYWYYYIHKIDQELPLPKENDVVTIAYDIRSLNNDTIYAKSAIGNIKVKIDKTALFPGLRTAVKQLKKGETATFFFPSSLAYGYHGDNNKIGINVPIISTLTLLDIQKTTNDTISLN
ncbi:gliding motility-associated peptidyl-prolyl isomerase GldI [Leptobacterium sp. I13]|uniref:gliding motility-associated peptidyl-prolyl isomerase GldI n=1 Tax=Leptobacterium meishanense TaxID=3128904 RepID=UPI0030EE29BD